MPRFNQKRWHPSRDSSLRHFQLAVKTKQVHLDVAVSYSETGEIVAYGCPCGCGEWPKGSKATFAMGHDQRMVGILQRTHLTNTLIVRHLVSVGDGDDNTLVAEEARTIAELLGDRFTQAIEAAELRREGKNREVLARALGSDRLIRVGRWEYTGQVAAVYGTPGDEQYEMEYVTKSGEVKRKRFDAADTEEVAT